MNARVSGRIPFVFVMLILAIAIVFMTLGLIGIEEVRMREHAIVAHGKAAQTARKAIQNCGRGLRAYGCPATMFHPESYLFICPLDSTNVTCAGMYVGSRGAELTSWIMSCSKWYAKATVCVVR